MKATYVWLPIVVISSFLQARSLPQDARSNPRASRPSTSKLTI